ncbi:MAG: enoyl-CoA hydratase/isomerase family protein [Halopenitus sp.]
MSSRGDGDDGGDTADLHADDCETVRVDADDAAHVVTVTIDRPDARNALDAQVRSELKRVCGRIEDSDARVVVLTGAREANAFVAGADVEELRERDTFEQREASRRPRVYEAVAGLPQPVIAAVNGHALGGGCELALACDVRVAHEQAKLGQPEIGLGLIPGGGGTQRLPRLVGEGQAMRLILSGELVDAEEAADIGLVEFVCEDGEFEDRVDELATNIADHSPLALDLGKEAVKASSRMGLDEGLDYEANLFFQLFASEDKNEGIDAFFEDREPEWEGE